MIRAVFWDFGGVISTSPFEAFNRLERERGLPLDFIRTINATNPDHNAWARLERNEIRLSEFDRVFAGETRAAGFELSGLAVIEILSGDLRPEMVEAIRRCRGRFINACLTNNIQVGDDGNLPFSPERVAAFREVIALFDAVIESSRTGLRKPNPLFYERACELVKVAPAEVVFLDDLGINLKPAKAMGMTTIKVIDSAQALSDLETVLGMPLR
jgi:putative hydrolase of the HAD superfamily